MLQILKSIILCLAGMAFLFLASSCIHDQKQATSAIGPCREIANNQYSTETIITNLPLRLNNEPYRLEITKCRCSDSLIAQIILFKNEKEVFIKDIGLHSFPDTANAFYDHATLQAIRYDAEREDRLYFTAMFKNSYSSATSQVGFAIYFRTEKLGHMDYWGRRGPTNTVSVLHTYIGIGSSIRYTQLPTLW